MPLIYRAMLSEGNKPKVGASKNTLGVKAGPESTDDIEPDAHGDVNPGTGGMSVAPAWRALPLHRIPRRLAALCPGAKGNNQMECWYAGQGPFSKASVTERLTLAIESRQHGLVEPATKMSLDDFQRELADTRDLWVVDPETRTQTEAVHDSSSV